jgi:hypothetical protein
MWPVAQINSLDTQTLKTVELKLHFPGPGTVVHIYNPNYSGCRGRRISVHG